MAHISLLPVHKKALYHLDGLQRACVVARVLVPVLPSINLGKAARPLLIKSPVHIAHSDLKMVGRQALLLDTNLSQLNYDILEMQPLFRQIYGQRELVEHLLKPRRGDQTARLFELILLLELELRIVQTQAFVPKPRQD